MSWSSTSLFGISKLAHHCPGPPSKEDPVLVPGATVVIIEHSDLSIANSWPLIVRGMSMLSWIPSAASARGLGRYHTPDRKILAYWWSYPQGKTTMGARGVEWVHSCVKCNLCLLLTNLCHSKENLPTFRYPYYMDVFTLNFVPKSLTCLPCVLTGWALAPWGAMYHWTPTWANCSKCGLSRRQCRTTTSPILKRHFFYPINILWMVFFLLTLQSTT